MIVDFTERLATDAGYGYQYGAEHWQNLLDAPDDTKTDFESKKKYWLFLWHDDDDILNDYGGCEGHVFTGEFLLMIRSKISDESQEMKYKDGVRYLKELSNEIRDMYNDCDGYRVKKWKKIEVYDQFDTNMDGLKIKFTIETTTGE
ncbi:hypothetical protein [uncultured Christiangramia sp.]|uniref:hypothetical protein n=1 Tax=uncultured Christiangramia sp. TaxID=503836 RepID=UPI00260FBFED|nr:hypothetical protein [uncultured Christiangramia sp.]